jgi:2-oxoglutarate dehydrogenase E2 component (dihydrolipoamide succinyltransferase)
MATEIKVPDLGESVIEATIARWLKQEGDAVKAGEPVLVLETDKVDLEVGAEKDGKLVRIDQQAGADVKVGDVLGLIDENGAAGESAPPAAAPKTEKQAEKPVEATAEAPAKAAQPVPSTAQEERATPVAKRVAEENQVDLSKVAPKDSKRVTKNDVQRYIEQRETPASAPQPVSGRASEEERMRMSRRRRTIAQRLVEAQHTAAMLTTFNEIDMSAVVDLRQRRKETFKQRYNIGLGLSSFFVKASIGALKKFPPLNAEIQGDEIVLKHYYDIGIAIGAAEGLVVPVLRNADRMSFAEIEKSIKDYAQQTEAGTLSLESLRGGTFTITNGGVFGSMLSTPILNPPQVAILGLHKIEQRPIALDGQVVIRPMMYVALSYDHRIVDGREAVQFLVRVKELIEDPESLLIEG